MTTRRITATCPTCEANIVLNPRGVHCYVYDDKRDGYYSYFCPTCNERVDKPMSTTNHRELTSIGVETTTIHVPLELLEPAHLDAPFTSDDQLDFHLLLGKRPDVVAILAIEMSGGIA